MNLIHREEKNNHWQFLGSGFWKIRRPSIHHNHGKWKIQSGSGSVRGGRINQGSTAIHSGWVSLEQGMKEPSSMAVKKSSLRVVSSLYGHHICCVSKQHTCWGDTSGSIKSLLTPPRFNALIIELVLILIDPNQTAAALSSLSGVVMRENSGGGVSRCQIPDLNGFSLKTGCCSYFLHEHNHHPRHCR